MEITNGTQITQIFMINVDKKVCESIFSVSSAFPAGMSVFYLDFSEVSNKTTGSDLPRPD